MKLILKISRNELRNLFYSPVAWFLAVVFMVQSAAYYVYAIFPLAKEQNIMLANNPKFKTFGIAYTSTIFLDTNGILTNALSNLYLFVPLLTMALISREINNGTIKLLYSSPIKVRQIVLGKYLAIMMYNLLLVSVLALFMIVGCFQISHVDYGLLLSALLGFYLLVCAYAAIGMFMSSLTAYQIVSAISTFVIIFVLTRIGSLWQKYDFVRDLTYCLSMSGRMFNFIVGLLTTKDVIYFLVIIWIFIGFTLVKLRSGRESKSWVVPAGRYLAVFAIALAVGYISSRPKLTGYWDTTATQRNTLHPNTQKIIKGFGNEPLEITLYSNLFAQGFRNTMPEARNSYLSGLWEPYVRFKPDINFKYVYYYDTEKRDSTMYQAFPHKNLKQISEKVADGYGIDTALLHSPAETRKMVDLQPESYHILMQLKYKGRTTFLRTYPDPEFWPNQMEIAAAFKRLLTDSLPKMYYLSGNLERSIYKIGRREYQLHATSKGNRSSLINLGFNVDTLFLDKQDIPKDATALVLADPKTELSVTTQNKLKQYIAAGGNMFILGEPGKQQMLNPVLKDLGVQLMDGTVIEPTKYDMPQMVRAFATYDATNLANDDMLLGLKESIEYARKEKETPDSLRVLMDGAAAIAVEPKCPFTVKTLLMSSPKRTWIKHGAFVTDSAEIKYEPQKGDVKSAYSTVVQLTRKINNKEQRIVLAGDADFMSNSELIGALIAIPAYSWLIYNNFPSYTPISRAKDVNILISTPVAKAQIIVFVWILPALLLIAGAVLLIRRKRK